MSKEIENKLTIKLTFEGEGYDSGFQLEVDRLAFGIEDEKQFNEFCHDLSCTLTEFILKRAEDG